MVSFSLGFHNKFCQLSLFPLHNPEILLAFFGIDEKIPTRPELFCINLWSVYLWWLQQIDKINCSVLLRKLLRFDMKGQSHREDSPVRDELVLEFGLMKSTKHSLEKFWEGLCGAGLCPPHEVRTQWSSSVLNHTAFGLAVKSLSCHHACISKWEMCWCEVCEPTMRMLRGAQIWMTH